MTLEQYLTHVEEQDGYCFNCQSWTMLGGMPTEEQDKRNPSGSFGSENLLCPLCLTYHLCGAESDLVVDHLAEKLG